MNKTQSFLEKIRDKTVHIIGASGTEGSTILEFLLAHNVTGIIAHDYSDKNEFKDHFFEFHDWMGSVKKQETYDRLIHAPVTFFYRDRYLQEITDGDVLFVPQSWFRYDFNQPLYHFFQTDHSPRQEFRQQIFSLTQLYLELFPGITVGVTGSNGKSTTTALVHEIVEHAVGAGNRGKLYWGGNDRKNGQPLLQIEQATQKDILLLEISNRQLSFRMGLSPHIAVITNIIPTHLDDHPDFATYQDVKREIVRYQTSGDFAVLNRDNPSSADSHKETPGKVLWYSLSGEVAQGTYLQGTTIMLKNEQGLQPVLDIDQIKLKGMHNINNIMAAVTVGSCLNIPPETMAAAVREFRGLEHRLEYVDTIENIAIYNDSAACNPHNITAAIESFTTPLLLIVGGSRKVPVPGEFDDLARLAKENRVKHVAVIGSAQPLIQAAFEKAEVPAEKINPAKDLKQALNVVASKAQAGDTIVLTPGCESFGEFKDYRDRGQKFKQYVAEMKKDWV